MNLPPNVFKCVRGIVENSASELHVFIADVCIAKLADFGCGFDELGSEFKVFANDVHCGIGG